MTTASRKFLSRYLHYVSAKHFRAHMPQVNMTSFLIRCGLIQGVPKQFCKF